MWLYTAFPLTGDRQEAIEKAESAGKSKRLPREVKQKLAKVARLAVRPYFSVEL